MNDTPNNVMARIRQLAEEYSNERVNCVYGQSNPDRVNMARHAMIAAMLELEGDLTRLQTVAKHLTDARSECTAQRVNEQNLQEQLAMMTIDRDLMERNWNEAMALTKVQPQGGSDSCLDGSCECCWSAPLHSAVKPDILVNAGALRMALNVLRRAGKVEVADELEKTAEPMQSNALLGIGSKP